MLPLAYEPRARVEGHEVIPLDRGWQAAATEPDAYPAPEGLAALGWLPARVPGTAAGALRDAGLHWGDLDAEDWWFRTEFDADAARPGEEVLLGVGGIATIAEVYLNGRRILDSESMFRSHAIDVGSLVKGENQLAIRCRALAPRLREQRRPRARWRTRVVRDGNIRWFRTMLLGRAPGFAPGPATVGPWRPVWIERRRGLCVEKLELRPRLQGTAGLLAVNVWLRVLDGLLPERVIVELDGPSGIHAESLELADVGDAERFATGELRIPSVRRWWPHTHGQPAMHNVRLLVESGSETVVIYAGRVGFRTLSAGPLPDHAVERDGLDLHVNGVRVFARGAVWTPIDPVGQAPASQELRQALELVCQAGMNMVRVPGIGAYEHHAFYDLCDSLGVLVWQDFMFANLDYPFADDSFSRLVEDEARQVLGQLGGRPSLAVLCGNSEIEQQVAMLGLDPMLGRCEFFESTLPTLAEAAEAGAIYIRSAPSGGDLPFRPSHGVANYYGVGGYRRPLADARLAAVRFASECLAFANVPDTEALNALLPDAPASIVMHHPRWKAGVPRDAGSGWDFDDVRDFYLRLLFGVDAGELRRVDHDRYLELSRAVSGEVMAEVFGEWRRSASQCGGGLVLWLRDLAPGAGWGVLDHRGMPKVVYHYLRRALAPIAVWTVDEGLGGVVVHVANDTPAMLSARLRTALYQDREQLVAEAYEDVTVAAHGGHERNVESLVGRFVDAAWAYRFGPPAHDAIAVSLERDGDAGTELLGHCVRFPAGRPVDVESAARLGLQASARHESEGTVHLTVSSRRLAYGVRIHVPGFIPADDVFSVEPGRTRSVVLHPHVDQAAFRGGALTALNLEGRVSITLPGANA